MRPFTAFICALPLTWSLLLLCASPAQAQSVTVRQDLLTSAGGRDSASTVSLVTATGQATGGLVASADFTVWMGVPADALLRGPAAKRVTVAGAVSNPSAAVVVNGIQATIVGSTFRADGITLIQGPNTITATATDPDGNRASVSVTVYLDARPITVEGAVSNPSAAVVVNGIQAAISGTTFRATGVLILAGPNTITATAADATGNEASASMTVYLDLRPPARPTVAETPAFTTAASYALTGTKGPGTSLWINGREVVPRNDATTWTTTVALVEGDNDLIVVAKDAVGNASAANTLNIVVDNLPPVITITAPARTNLTPFPLQGTVDDSLTRVVVNGVTATRTRRSFQAAVPLVAGPNSLTVTATSPNGYVTTQNVSITLGTIPTILSIQPADGTKLYAGLTATITVSATDPENDPLEYQILLDGQILADWAAPSSRSWTPTGAQRGLHALEVRVRDGFGGYAAQQADIFVGRAHVQPLSP